MDIELLRLQACLMEALARRDRRTPPPPPPAEGEKPPQQVTEKVD